MLLTCVCEPGVEPYHSCNGGGGGGGGRDGSGGGRKVVGASDWSFRVGC